MSGAFLLEGFLKYLPSFFFLTPKRLGAETCWKVLLKIGLLRQSDSLACVFEEQYVLEKGKGKSPFASKFYCPAPCIPKVRAIHFLYVGDCHLICRWFLSIRSMRRSCVLLLRKTRRFARWQTQFSVHIQLWLYVYWSPWVNFANEEIAQKCELEKRSLNLLIPWNNNRSKFPWLNFPHHRWSSVWWYSVQYDAKHWVTKIWIHPCNFVL